MTNSEKTRLARQSGAIWAFLLRHSFVIGHSSFAIFFLVSSDLSAITSSGASVWSVAANVAGPVLQAGRLYGQYKQSKADLQEAKLEYKQAALGAFHDVANALVSRQKLEAVRVQQSRAVAAYQEAVTVSTQRYIAGKASYYEVLEAQQQLFPAENSLAQTELNQLLAIVQLYKALGGGWTESINVDSGRTDHKPDRAGQTQVPTR